ncbi:MAG: hypothetical protein AAF757_19535 [Cyanobacteria bacterium P01_D01_bin.116]
MENLLVDTNLLFACCLDQSDFEENILEITERANNINASGKLALPIVCWKFEENLFQVGEERTNLLNFMAIILLRNQDPRGWEMVDSWVCDSEQQAYTALNQYSYSFE